jgi:hypothetical protein
VGSHSDSARSDPGAAAEWLLAARQGAALRQLLLQGGNGALWGTRRATADFIQVQDQVASFVRFPPGPRDSAKAPAADWPGLRSPRAESRVVTGG